MGDGPKISIQELRQFASTLLDTLEEKQGASVEIDQDYFWSIVRTERTRLAIEPTSLTIGQISECIEHLSRMLTEPDTRLTFGLVWLAEILRTIGDQFVA